MARNTRSACIATKFVDQSIVLAEGQNPEIYTVNQKMINQKVFRFFFPDIKTIAYS